MIDKLKEFTKLSKNILDKAQKIKPIVPSSESPKEYVDGSFKEYVDGSFKEYVDDFNINETKEVLLLLKLNIDKKFGFDLSELNSQILEYICSGIDNDEEYKFKTVTVANISINDEASSTIKLPSRIWC